jgi:Phasin protein
MARSTTDFADVARQNTERAVQATNWMCAVAEQNLIQNKAVFEGLLTIARNTLRSIDQQSSAISEHSIAVAEQALSNAFDFSHKVLRIKDPQQLAQIQSEFISRQAQVLGNHTWAKNDVGAHDIAKATQEAILESRRRSKACMRATDA